MKKIILSIFAVTITIYCTAQVYRDGFTNNGTLPNSAPYWSTSSGYLITHIDNTTTTNITGNSSIPPWARVNYNLYDNPQMLGIGSYTGTGNPISWIDMSADTIVYVIARASTGNPQLRMNIKDVNGYVSNSGTIVDMHTLSDVSQVYVYKYTVPEDTSSTPSCSSTSPCNVDLSRIVGLCFSINPSTGGYAGTVIIDYIQIGGTAPTLPDITLTSPTNGSTLGNPITLTATTSSTNIQSVSFFTGTTLINIDLTSPYTYTWTNATLGSHVITAAIHTNLGIANTSTPVFITVAEPEINVKQGSTNIASGGSYDFGSVSVGSSAGPVTFTIENTGGLALNLTGAPIIQLSGTHASEFSVNQSSTSASVAPTTGTTTFTVTFSPISAGAKSATITILNNDSDEGTYTIELIGTGSTSTNTLASLDNYILLYPNPAYEKIVISFNGITGEYLYSLKNQLGFTMAEGEINITTSGSDMEIDMTNIPAGVYFLEVSSNGFKGVKKVIKR